MWWEDPPHPGVPFVRALDPNNSQDHRFLRVDAQHQKFPFRDGPRGVGWMSPYVSGQIDSRGGFAFVETGGPARYMKPDGEIITVAGWRVRPDRDPIWKSKPLDTIRGVMEKRGQWVDGRGEFFTPLDVAIDPLNENAVVVDTKILRGSSRSGLALPVRVSSSRPRAHSRFGRGTVPRRASTVPPRSVRSVQRPTTWPTRTTTPSGRSRAPAW